MKKRERNFYSYTFTTYRNNKIRTIIKGTALYLVFFVFVFVILKAFSVSVGPETFLYVFVGAMVALFVFDRKLDKLTDNYLLKNYQTWGKGSGSELISSKSLDPLKAEGYRVIEDIQNDRGNVDILCVGPKGIFAIECKAHNGTISWDNQLLRNGQALEKDFIKQVHAERFFVIDSIKEHLGKEYDVVGILEFNNAQRDASLNGQKEGVWIGGRGFAKWVIQNKGKETLTRSEVDAICGVFEKVFAEGIGNINTATIKLNGHS